MPEMPCPMKSHYDGPPESGQPETDNGAARQADRGLIAAARPESATHRLAVARKDPACLRLTEALIEAGDARAIAVLLASRSSECPERLLLACLDRLPHDETLHEAMIERELLPPSVVQRLAILTSDRLRAALAARHELPTGPEAEPGELGPDRPDWWSQHIAGMFR